MLLSKGTSASRCPLLKGKGVNAALSGVHGATLRDKLRNCDIRKGPNVQPLLRIERSQLRQLRWFGQMSRLPWKRLARQVLLATLTVKRPRGRQRLGGVTTSLTLLGSVLVWSQQNHLRLRLVMSHDS